VTFESLCSFIDSAIFILILGCYDFFLKPNCYDFGHKGDFCNIFRKVRKALHMLIALKTSLGNLGRKLSKFQNKFIIRI